MNERVATGIVPSVARAAQILDLLAAQQPMSLAALVRETSVPKSTVLDICKTLVAAGLLARDEMGQYSLGHRVMDLGNAYLGRLDLARDFVRLVNEQPDLGDETVILMLRDGLEVVCASRRLGSHPLAVTYAVGDRFPAHCTAAGKLLLSELPQRDLDELLGEGPLPAITGNSIRTVSELHANLGVIRQRGYAINDEETADGMYCIAVPVRDPSTSQATASVSFSMVKARLDPTRWSTYLSSLNKLAASVSPHVMQLQRRT